MKQTGFLYDKRYLLHETGQHHPECSNRLTAIYNGLEQAGLLTKLTHILPKPADLKYIEQVHYPEYIVKLEEACLLGLDQLDYADNQICPKTYETALLAAGGILDALDLVMEGSIDNAFCAVRPPGHHAEAGRAMGFCYFNNVAIAARYLQNKWRVQRVAIIDFDVHHGNGTQHIFESDPMIFYTSIHEHPSFSFPGTGREFERGKDFGYGCILNMPILPGQGDSAYKEAIIEEMLPALYDFAPQFILLSTGFDGHADDDMSGINLSTDVFSWMVKQFMQLAEKCANGKLVSVLEGGYCLERLPELAQNHVEILMK